MRYITPLSQIVSVFLNICSYYYTSSNSQTSEPVGAKFCFVLQSVCRTAGFGTLTLFPLSGRTNSAFNYTLLQTNTYVQRADISQYCYTNCLTNHLAGFSHIVMLPFFVM